MHVYIVGCKGIPAAYGGYETFVDALVSGQQSGEIKYHVACAVDSYAGQPMAFSYREAECFRIRWKRLGAGRAVFYDLDALEWILKDVKGRNPSDAANARFLVYVLACRIGPFFRHYAAQIHKLGGLIYINPDGHEWKRAKWNAPIRRYWKLSERLMVKYADLVICDSKNIESYIQKEYHAYSPRTTYLAYGADIIDSPLSGKEEIWLSWCREHAVEPGQYYLVVGRFVPENNYETIIREFMASHTDRKLVIVTNQEPSAYYEHLKQTTDFPSDRRICFVGTVYERRLLQKIRKEAYAYIHGHSVGGTNPSLLEALASTDVNLLYAVGFNEEVAGKGARYWSCEPGSLAELIDEADAMKLKERAALGGLAKQRIREDFTWEKIIREYEELFLSSVG